METQIKRNADAWLDVLAGGMLLALLARLATACAHTGTRPPLVTSAVLAVVLACNASPAEPSWAAGRALVAALRGEGLGLAMGAWFFATMSAELESRFALRIPAASRRCRPSSYALALCAAAAAIACLQKLLAVGRGAGAAAPAVRVFEPLCVCVAVVWAAYHAAGTSHNAAREPTPADAEPTVGAPAVHAAAARLADVFGVGAPVEALPWVLVGGGALLGGPDHALALLSGLAVGLGGLAPLGSASQASVAPSELFQWSAVDPTTPAPHARALARARGGFGKQGGGAAAGADGGPSTRALRRAQAAAALLAVAFSRQSAAAAAPTRPTAAAAAAAAWASAGLSGGEGRAVGAVAFTPSGGSCLRADAPTPTAAALAGLGGAREAALCRSFRDISRPSASAGAGGGGAQEGSRSSAHLGAILRRLQDGAGAGSRAARGLAADSPAVLLAYQLALDSWMAVAAAAGAAPGAPRAPVLAGEAVDEGVDAAVRAAPTQRALPELDAVVALIYQALGRTELPAEMSDEDVAFQIGSQVVGHGAMALRPAARPIWLRAVGHYRAQRRQVADAFVQLKTLLSVSDAEALALAAEVAAIKAEASPQRLAPRGDAPNGDDVASLPVPPGADDGDATALATAEPAPPSSGGVSALLLELTTELVNGTLAEYDLPLNMTDSAVVVELLQMLELPPPAELPTQVGIALGLAVRAHRSDRTAGHGVALAHSMSRVRGRLWLEGWLADGVDATADGSAPPRAAPLRPPVDPALKLESALAAAALSAGSRALDLLVTEAISWQELPLDGDDGVAVDELLALAQLTRTQLHPGALDRFATGARTHRESRRAEFRRQQAFEALLAIVKEQLALSVSREPIASDDTSASANADADADADADDDDADASVGADSDAASALSDSAPAEADADEASTDAAAAARDARLAHLDGARAGSPASRALNATQLAQLSAHVDVVLSGFELVATLDDKALVAELCRMLSLPEGGALPPELDEALSLAVRAHREARAADDALPHAAAESSLTVDARAEAEAAGLQYALRLALPYVEPLRALPAALADTLATHADGNSFAVLLYALLRAVGARARLTLGCVPPDDVEAAVAEAGSAAEREARRDALAALADAQSGPALAAGECALFSEVRIGKGTARLEAWAAHILAHYRESRELHYRTDREGYTWINLDWHDVAKVQAPGAPYRKYRTALNVYADQGPHGRWESDLPLTGGFVEPIGAVTITRPRPPPAAWLHDWR